MSLHRWPRLAAYFCIDLILDFLDEIDAVIAAKADGTFWLDEDDGDATDVDPPEYGGGK